MGWRELEVWGGDCVLYVNAIDSSSETKRNLLIITVGYTPGGVCQMGLIRASTLKMILPHTHRIITIQRQHGCCTLHHQYILEYVCTHRGCGWMGLKEGSQAMYGTK